MSTNDGIPDHALPPPKTEEYVFGDWTLSATKCHIMGSKCEKPTVCDGADDLNILCAFCRFERSLKLPNLPDMIFDQNLLEVRHKSGSTIRFSALDALDCVSHTEDTLQVAHAEAWRKARDGCEFLKKVHAPYDWTFTTKYCGSLMGGMTALESDERIDLEKLKTREEIKFYEEVYLYEDELDDNGSTKCVVKLRAMPSGFFIVFRHYLRVDHVIVRVNDTRLYHPAGTEYILRESSTREAAISQLKVSPSIYKNPDLVWQHLPLTYEKIDKLITKS